MILKKPAFNALVNNFCADIPAIENIYVVFKAAYREIDLSKEKYMIARLEFEDDFSSYVWDWDWDEGQEFIDLFGIYSESDILSIILMPNSIDLIKKRLLETAFNHVGILCDGSELLEDIESRIDYWLKGEKNAD